MRGFASHQYALAEELARLEKLPKLPPILVGMFIRTGQNSRNGVRPVSCYSGIFVDRPLVSES